MEVLNQSLQGKVHKKQIQMKETHDRKGHERQFTPGESVYVKNFGSILKWLIGTIIHVTSSMSYAVALQDGRECRRHIDHLRSRRADSDSVIPLCQREQVDTDTEITPAKFYKPFGSVLPNRETAVVASIPDAPTRGSRTLKATSIWDRETAPEAKTNTMRFKEES